MENTKTTVTETKTAITVANGAENMLLRRNEAWNACCVPIQGSGASGHLHRPKT